MTKKITVNGQEYNFEDQPDDKKKNVFMDSSIVSGGKTYKNFNDLPPEVKAKIQESLSKVQNVPFAKSILKMFNLDINNLHNMQLNSGSDPFKNPTGNSNPFGNIPGGSNPFQQFGNPMFSGKKGGGAGWVIGFVILFLGLGGVIWLMSFGIANIGSTWEESFELKGDPTHFDPIAAVEEMRSHIDPNAKLSSIDISYVKSDGTMDLTVTSYRPNTRYQFYRELSEPPKDAPPVGAGGTKDGKWYEPVDVDVFEPGQWRHVKKMGGGVSTEYSYIHKGIDLDRSTPTTSPSEFVDDPKCSIADFWKEAIRQGAPADAVANVSYDHYGYEFDIYDADVDLEFDFDCQLKGDDWTPSPTPEPAVEEIPTPVSPY